MAHLLSILKISRSPLVVDEVAGLAAEVRSLRAANAALQVERGMQMRFELVRQVPAMASGTWSCPHRM